MFIAWLLKFCLGFRLLLLCLAQYSPLPRWGQATTLIDDFLLIHGGRTDQLGIYTYTSAPPNNDVLYLSLASPFDTSSTPWQLISNSTNVTEFPGPIVAWHTISAINATEILLFGGELGPNSALVLPDQADSAALLSLTNNAQPGWTLPLISWANEPLRRMRHSSSSANGMVFLVGGEKTDGSNLALSDHYVFNPDIPSFSLLPPSNGPPDLFGHASVVLTTGKLIVFGGYCGSQAALLPLTTIWMMDTTQSSLQWSLASVSHTTVPPPRQAFAATTLANGSIFIHGGSNALFQTPYSDGWVLDTTQTPMVWSPVSALSQLGARRDHFAVTSGTQIIFGFGYGDTTVAPTTPQIFDATTGQWTTSFTPPPPSSTSNSPSSTKRPPTSGAGPTSGTGNPGPDNNDASSDTASHSTDIAVGASLGALALVVGGITALYIVRKRGGLSRKRFGLIRNGYLHDFGDGESAHSESAIPVIMNSHKKRSAYTSWFHGPQFLGLGSGKRAQTARERRDILADEDTRQFWYHDLEGSGGSTWSLRGVGAIIGGRIGMRSREPSTFSNPGSPVWEKSDAFADGAALMKDEQGLFISEPPTTLWPQSRRYQSYSSGMSYSDPFADPDMEERDEDHTHRDTGRYADEKETRALKRVSPPKLPSLHTALLMPTAQGLSPVTEQSSRKTMSDPSYSQDNLVSLFEESRATSNTSHGDRLIENSPTSSNRNPGAIVHSSTPPSQPIRRSDSWWARFARTSFLDRKSSDGGRPYARRLDIRDPHPPPRLVTIEESAHSKPNSFSSLPGAHLRQQSHLYDVNHGHSTTSLQTTRTADTVALERLGIMDVVQRATTSSHRMSYSSIETHHRLSESGVTADKSVAIHQDQEDVPVVQSPTEITPAEESLPLTPTDTSLRPRYHLSDSSKPKVTSPGGAVAARVQAYERRMSQEVAATSPPATPDARNTRKREEKPRDKIISINYGLAPRPNLYVANPDRSDRTHGSSSST